MLWFTVKDLEVTAFSECFLIILLLILLSLSLLFIMLWSNGIYHNAIIYLFIYSFFREVLILKHAMMLLLPWKDKIFFVISVADLLSIEAKWVKFLKVIYMQYQIQWNMYNLEIPIFYISLLNLYAYYNILSIKNKFVRSPQCCNRWVPLYVSSLSKRFWALLCINHSRIFKYLEQIPGFLFIYILALTLDALISACQRSRFALACDFERRCDVIIQK